MIKYILLLFILGLNACSQTVQTVKVNPTAGTNPTCRSAPNLQYNEINGTFWVCIIGSGWTQFTSESAAGSAGSIQLSDGSGGFAVSTDNKAFISSANAENSFTFAKSGVSMVDSQGNEVWRIWGTDPDIANNNSANLYIGKEAGLNATTNSTTFGELGVGYEALKSVTTGDHNSCMGFRCLTALTEGQENTAFGNYGLYQLTTGQGNDAQGYLALRHCTTCLQNIAIGHRAGGNITSGQGNTFIGYEASAWDNLNNSMAIGQNATVFNSNTIVFGDSNITDVYFGSTTPSAKLRGKSIYTTTNCTDSAGAASCGSAPTGAVVIDAGNTSVVVSTTAINTASRINITLDSSLGTELSVTCNTDFVNFKVSARTNGVSFTLAVETAPVTNPFCFTYTILN